jgi:hypothetical protein
MKEIKISITNQSKIDIQDGKIIIKDPSAIEFNKNQVSMQELNSLLNDSHLYIDRIQAKLGIINMNMLDKIQETANKLNF